MEKTEAALTEPSAAAALLLASLLPLRRRSRARREMIGMPVQMVPFDPDQRRRLYPTLLAWFLVWLCPPKKRSSR